MNRPNYLGEIKNRIFAEKIGAVFVATDFADITDKSIANVVLYALRIPFARAIGWDLAIFESMAFTVFFESCIQSGLIQSNTRYADMFRASRDLSVQITDNHYVVQYSAENAEPMCREIHRLISYIYISVNQKAFISCLFYLRGEPNQHRNQIP